MSRRRAAPRGKASQLGLTCAAVAQICLAATQTPWVAAAAGSLCAVPAPTYVSQCFSPDKVQRVDRLLKVPPVDPTRAVGRFTHLALTEVMASKRLLPIPTRRVVALSWLYGTFPPGTSGIPEPSPPSPKWVVVEEFAAPFKHLKSVLVRRGAAAGPQGTAPDWQLQENLPRRSLGVAIWTNEDEAIIRHIGRELVKEAERG